METLWLFRKISHPYLQRQQSVQHIFDKDEELFSNKLEQEHEPIYLFDCGETVVGWKQNFCYKESVNDKKFGRHQIKS